MNRFIQGLVITVTALCATAGAARADIVYDVDAQTIEVANDDGSGRQAIATVVPGSPGVQVADMKSIIFPDVAPNGTKVVFEGDLPGYSALAPGACGDNCAGVYTYDNGTVTRLSPLEPGPCNDPCAKMESQPEISPTGQIVAGYEWATYVNICSYTCSWWLDSSHSWTALTQPPHGTPVDGPSAADIPVIDGCGGHDLDSMPQYPTVSADGSQVAYVNCLDAANDYRYEVVASGGKGESPTMCREDDTAIQDVAFLADGRLIDGEIGDNRGLWSFPCPQGTSARYVLAAPSGVTLQSPRDTAGGKILFVALQPNGDGTAGDVWSVPSSCGTGGTPCQFPADATQITHIGSVAGVGWTAQTIPVPAPPSSGGSGTTPTPAPTPTTTPAPAGTQTATPVGSIERVRYDRRHKLVTVGVACSGQAGQSCQLSVVLSVVEKLRGKKVVALSARTRRHTVTLGTARATLAGGTGKQVKVKLDGAARKLLARRSRIPMRVSVKQGARLVSTKTLTARR